MSAVDTATIRRAAEVMRREDQPFFDKLSDLLIDLADGIDDDGFAGGCPVPDGVRTVAEAYLTDPGAVPERVA